MASFETQRKPKPRKMRAAPFKNKMQSASHLDVKI